MKRATPEMRVFAGCLVGHEANAHRLSQPQISAAFRVCEKLRPPLATLMGHSGFRAVLAHALALASTEQPRLRHVQVRTDGILTGLHESSAKTLPRKSTEEDVVLVAHLLGLLMALIGEKLSRRIVSQTWPDLHHLELPPTQRKKK